MELKGQSLIPLFIVILVLGFASGVLGGYGPLLTLHLHEQGVPLEEIGIYLTIRSLVGTAINPFMILIGVYFVGRKIDLKAKLVPLIVLIFVGSYLGNLLGHIVAPLIIAPQSLSASVQMGLTYLPLQRFFVAFTALSLAYIRQK